MSNLASYIGQARVAMHSAIRQLELAQQETTDNELSTTIDGLLRELHPVREMLLRNIDVSGLR